VIARLGRALLELVRGRVSRRSGQPSDQRDEVQAERLDAARQRLKETIPPPQEE
jgi:ribosomal protein S12 methylthiotransferase accessory factor YcaO